MARRSWTERLGEPLAGARAAHERGDVAAAEAVYDRVLADHPDDPAAVYLKGLALHHRKHSAAAVPYLRRGAEGLGDVAEAWSNLGNALRATHRHDEALAALEHATAVDPGFAGAFCNMGMVLRQLGRLEAAADAYRAALTVEPGHPTALNGLSRTGRSRLTDADVDVLRRAVGGGRLKGQALADAAYSLGKHFDDRGDFDQAFRMFRKANSVKRGRFDRAPFAAEVDAIEAAPPPTVSDAPPSPGTRPVFVFGMPRSGTTLVEQILAAHPDVSALGETNAVEQWMTRSLTDAGHAVPGGAWPAAAAAMDVSGLSGAVRAAWPDAPPAAVVDKSLFTDRFIEPLLRAEPDAVLIACRRDPRDVGLSIYFTDLSANRPFATELRWIGELQALYARRLRHWRRVLGDHLIEVAYEDLIDDPDPQIRRLIERAGLPWDDRCLRFHDFERAVTTPSDWQVRQPIFRRSMGRWRNYEAWLGPLLDGLGDETEDLRS
jgi:tetratricopeptide (TPR) repeat protein